MPIFLCLFIAATLILVVPPIKGRPRKIQANQDEKSSPAVGRIAGDWCSRSFRQENVLSRLYIAATRFNSIRSITETWTSSSMACRVGPCW